jgi:hypothetical protein
MVVGVPPRRRATVEGGGGGTELGVGGCQGAAASIIGDRRRSEEGGGGGNHCVSHEWQTGGAEGEVMDVGRQAASELETEGRDAWHPATGVAHSTYSAEG